MSTSDWPPPEESAHRGFYEQLANDEFATGPRGTVVFVVFTDQLDLRRGDLYVALGMAKALSRLGWGVRMLPGPRWYDPLEGPADIAIAMIESFVPGLLPPHIATIAWCRNWTSKWAELPYLSEFDAVWSSSAASAAILAERRGGPVEVVPIGVDDELFAAGSSDRDIPVLSTANFWGEERGLAASLAAVSRRHRVVWVGGGTSSGDAGAIEFPGSASYFAVPGLYRRSRIVIDDVIPPAKLYGNHNSRLFESISAGAVPITNERLGLDDLGLAEVPVFEGAADLVAQVDALLGDPEGTEALAGRLQRVVSERHTFDHRAAQVDAQLESVRAAASARVTRSRLVRWIANERIEKDSYLQRLAEAQARVDELEAGAAVEPSTAAVMRTAVRRLVALPGRVLRRLTPRRD